MQITDHIKLHTQSLHTRTEKKLASLLFNSDLEKHQYTELLARFHNAYAALEAGIESHRLPRELMQGRSKLPLLRRDFEDLAAAFQSGGPCTVTLNSEAEAMGALYVMEGATLGGQIIARQLQQRTWIEGLSGLNFFLSYGAQRQVKWDQFCTDLTAFDRCHPTARPAVLAGAELAFKIISSRLFEDEDARNI